MPTEKGLQFGFNVCLEVIFLYIEETEIRLWRKLERFRFLPVKGSDINNVPHFAQYDCSKMKDPKTSRWRM